MTRKCEQGSATVLGIGVIGVMLAVLTFLGGLVLSLNAQYQAHASADFAALAGAKVLNDPRQSGDPCLAARHVVTDSRLTSCTVSGAYVEITTIREVSYLGFTFELTGSARAGPAHLSQ